jgi:hypothetical protein
VECETPSFNTYQKKLGIGNLIKEEFVYAAYPEISISGLTSQRETALSYSMIFPALLVWRGLLFACPDQGIGVQRQLRLLVG